MANISHKSTLDGLPKQFVNSLRVLFDILDEEKAGFVKLADIENRWQENPVEGMPRGVVDALKKVTPQNGKLTFERFVAGLKIAMLRNKGDNGTRQQSSLSNLPPDIVQSHGTSSHSRPESQSQNYLQSQRYLSSRKTTSASDVLAGPQKHTATVRPTNVMSQQRTKSMPQLQAANSREVTNVTPPPDLGRSMPPPITAPYRVEQHSIWNPSASAKLPDTTNSHDDRNISAALKRWQQERLLSEVSEGRNAQRPHDGLQFNSRRGLGDGRASIASTSALDQLSSQTGDLALGSRDEMAANKRGRRKEPRRHTLANGIDYNMIKRMKQLEQEKDVLLQGLESVEQAREWYHTQIRSVQDKQKYIGKTASPHDYSVEAYEERMKFQTSRIFELNQQIKALVESSEKGFPFHMNLAVGSPTRSRDEPSETDNIISMLKAQNRMLTGDINQKSDRISQLEREKSTLIREVFEARSKNKNANYDDTTFL